MIRIKKLRICPNLKYELYFLETPTELKLSEEAIKKGTVKETRIFHLR